MERRSNLQHRYISLTGAATALHRGWPARASAAPCDQAVEPGRATVPLAIDVVDFYVVESTLAGNFDKIAAGRAIVYRDGPGQSSRQPRAESTEQAVDWTAEGVLDFLLGTERNPNGVLVHDHAIAQLRRENREAIDAGLAMVPGSDQASRADRCRARPGGRSRNMKSPLGPRRAGSAVLESAVACNFGNIILRSEPVTRRWRHFSDQTDAAAFTIVAGQPIKLIFYSTNSQAIERT
jgi:hypothetical protein